MKKKILFVLAAFITMTLFVNQAHAQVSKIAGLWKTIDDETGEAKSYVSIKQAKNGKFYGAITKLLQEPQDKLCEECKGSLKNKRIVGMAIVINMKSDGKKLKGGKILDPGNGKWYHCTMEIDAKNPKKLNVRGSIDGWGLAGRTQSWYRVK
ncbi:MAG: DUF2147 domain-containing protein [Bacteroidales bacterium]|nr:DUF2147 domain-containing protein [Bacteroidales bacterium]